MPVQAEIAAERIETHGEWLANALSSALGLLFVIAIGPVVLEAARDAGSAFALAGGAVFWGALLALYFFSTLYHALPPGRAKTLVRLGDHSAIFLLIAGTYTPFAVGPLRESGGWWLLGCEWVLAVLGIAFKLSGGIRYRRLSNIIYVGMGWLGIFWIRPVLEHMPVAGPLWLLAGGVAYTAGIVFYVAKHRRYAHFVWHLFVLAGTCCHAYAVVNYGFPD